MLSSKAAKSPSRRLLLLRVLAVVARQHIAYARDDFQMNLLIGIKRNAFTQNKHVSKLTEML